MTNAREAWTKLVNRRQPCAVDPGAEVSFDTSLQREWARQSGAALGEVVNTGKVREYQPEAIIAGRLYPLVLLCQAHGLPEPMPEYAFHPVRGWKFDYAHVDQKIATEVEGGIWRRGGGAHSHPLNILRDMEKYNAAAVLGWRIIRVQPERIGDAIPMLRELLR
jgi:hypothetical protein